MTNEQQGQELTPEQYKAEVLKQNFARRCADYEDVIASLQTQVAILQQQIQQSQPKTGGEVPVEAPEVDGETNQLPPPPEPPAE